MDRAYPQRRLNFFTFLQHSSKRPVGRFSNKDCYQGTAIVGGRRQLLFARASTKRSIEVVAEATRISEGMGELKLKLSFIPDTEST